MNRTTERHIEVPATQTIVTPSIQDHAVKPSTLYGIIVVISVSIMIGGYLINEGAKDD